jgi:biopolymer transport protein ExbB
MIDFVLNLTKQGGPFVWLIMVLAIIIVVLAVERFYYFHSTDIDRTDFMQGICSNLKKGNVIECVSHCDDTPGAISQIIRVSILHRKDEPVILEGAIQEAARNEQFLLEKRMDVLATLAQGCGVLGLLGTVAKLIEAFRQIGIEGSFVNLSNLAPYVGGALVAAASGMTVSFVAYMVYNIYLSRIRSILRDMEKTAYEMMYFIRSGEFISDDRELS